MNPGDFCYPAVNADQLYVMIWGLGGWWDFVAGVSRPFAAARAGASSRFPGAAAALAPDPATFALKMTRDAAVSMFQTAVIPAAARLDPGAALVECTMNGAGVLVPTGTTYPISLSFA